jgi:hypothetical protein
MKPLNKITKTSLLNIDSSSRNINPKNIFETDTHNLPTDPITINKDSNIITINYPNHNFKVNDNIAILNVEGFSTILQNTFYLINNFNYLLIKLENNYIDINYNQDLFINIELVDLYIQQNTTQNNLLSLSTYYYINNIPINYILGIKKIVLINNLINNNIKLLITPILFEIFETTDLNIINNSLILIELPFNYINIINDYFKINQTFKISYLQIGGIDLGYINSNFPINNINYQSCQIITNIIDDNHFQITINYKSFFNSTFGGNNVQVLKIINTINGYPYINKYTIHLKKAFNNVTSIRLISSEIPFVDDTIKININNKLYWQNIEDGDNIYSISLSEGFYSTDTLITNLTNNMNSVLRITSNKNNIINKYNNFNIIFDPLIQSISFTSYNLINLPNCLSIRNEIINSEKYFILNISHPNNYVQIGDIITISLSNNITFNNSINDSTYQIISIDQSYINKNHIIYSVDIETQSYNIIIGKFTEIKTTIVNYFLNGGETVYIQSNTKFRFLFNKQDTLGNILGFKNVGDLYSITDFKSTINNQDNYIYNNNLNSVGDIINYSNGFINLSGNNNYILMYLNDIEYICNNNIPSCFAKILLSGNPGDILFNTFVPQPVSVYSKNFPIQTLYDINISYVYGDGTNVNFRNINHSFTLEITEELSKNQND